MRSSDPWQKAATDKRGQQCFKLNLLQGVYPSESWLLTRLGAELDETDGLLVLKFS